MKISKLFHWLYAILMLLPILVFIPNAFYFGFNEQAVAQEKTEQVPVYYESNDVNTIDDIIIGNIYKFSTNFTIPNDFVKYQYLYFDKIFQPTNYVHFGPNNLGINTPYLYYSNNDRINLGITYNNTDYIYIFNNTNNGYFYFVPLTTVYLNQYLSLISKCEENFVKGYVPLTTNMSITDSMSYAWNSTWQNSLFSWAYSSFLTQPFIYIGNLFNVPVDNSLYYALSYWLDISLIWLTFDLLMYVPLLVHRWLDKGIIE